MRRTPPAACSRPARPRVSPSAPRLLPLLAPLVVGGLLLGGCGGGDDGSDGPGEASGTPTASAADQDCRDQWRALGDRLPDGDDDHPSSLPGRTTSIAASVDYYATTAKASDCERTLAAEKTQLTSLAAFVTTLRPYDLAYQLDRVGERAAAYARPSGKAGRGAPTAAQVEAALRTMERGAEQAAADQDPAWQQATVVDLSEKKSRAKALKDLAFLSRESRAWRQGHAAELVVRRALTAAG